MAFGTAHCHATRRRLAVARTFSLPWGVPRRTSFRRHGAQHGRRSPSEHPRQRLRELVEGQVFATSASGLGTGWKPWRLNPARRRLREAFGMQRGGITEHTCYEEQPSNELDDLGTVVASQISHSRQRLPGSFLSRSALSGHGGADRASRGDRVATWNGTIAQFEATGPGDLVNRDTCVGQPTRGPRLCPLPDIHVELRHSPAHRNPL